MAASEIEKFGTMIMGEIQDLRTEMQDEFKNVRTEMQAGFDRIGAELSTISRRLDRLEEQGASSAGFAKEIDTIFVLA